MLHVKRGFPWLQQVPAQQQSQALARHNRERDEVGPSGENCWASGANRALKDASVTEPVPLLLLRLRNDLVEPQAGKNTAVILIPAVSSNAATASRVNNALAGVNGWLRSCGGSCHPDVANW